MSPSMTPSPAPDAVPRADGAGGPCDLPVDPLCFVVTDTRRHGHPKGGMLSDRPQNEQIDSIRAHLPAARAPGLRGMHGRAELPAAQGLGVAELGRDRGPACQPRIDHLPGLVE